MIYYAPRGIKNDKNAYDIGTYITIFLFMLPFMALPCFNLYTLWTTRSICYVWGTKNALIRGNLEHHLSNEQIWLHTAFNIEILGFLLALLIIWICRTYKNSEKLTK